MTALKTSMAAVAALIAGATTASAQDWTGFYAGGSVGHTSGESDANVALGGQWSIESQALRDGVTDLWSASLEPEGWGFGLQGGYNHQFVGGFVLGGELGYTFFDADDGRSTPQTIAAASIPGLTYAVGNTAELESALSLRANVGYNFDPVLAYVILGYSWADLSYSAEVLSNGNYSKAGETSENVGGFTYGVGGAMRLGGPWSARLEYTHTEYDEASFATAYRPGSSFVTPAYTETFTQDLTQDTIQVGLNFHF